MSLKSTPSNIKVRAIIINIKIITIAVVIYSSVVVFVSNTGI